MNVTYCLGWGCVVQGCGSLVCTHIVWPCCHGFRRGCRICVIIEVPCWSWKNRESNLTKLQHSYLWDPINFTTDLAFDKTKTENLQKKG